MGITTKTAITKENEMFPKALLKLHRKRPKSPPIDSGMQFYSNDDFSLYRCSGNVGNSSFVVRHDKRFWIGFSVKNEGT